MGYRDSYERDRREDDRRRGGTSRTGRDDQQSGRSRSRDDGYGYGYDRGDGDGGQRDSRRDRDGDRRRRHDERDRDRDLDRTRRRSRSRDRTRGPARSANAREEEDRQEPYSYPYPTAAQVCSMLCEMYGQKAGLPAGTLEQCFSEDPVARVTRLSSGAVVARGADTIVASLKAAPAGKPSLSSTVFVESAGRSEQSLVLAFFTPGGSPGFTYMGLAGPEGGQDHPLAMLLRCQKGKIDQVWVGKDEEGLGSSCGRGKLTGSQLWADALEVIRESMGPSASACKVHINNYAVSSDSAGLGIGETSAIETFDLALGSA